MSATSSIYVNVPIVLIDIFLPQATAVYALAERIVRLALYSTRPVVQIAQGWVPSPDPDELAARARRVTAIALGLGALGGIVYAVAGPWIGDLLSGGTLAIPLALAVPMAVNLAAILASQLTGFACLTAFGPDPRARDQHDRRRRRRHRPDAPVAVLDRRPRRGLGPRRRRALRARRAARDARTETSQA